VDLSPFEKSPQQQAYEQALSAWQMVSMESAKKGINPGPQPMPQQFGYDPQMQSPQAQGQAAISAPGSTGGLTNGAV